MFFVDAAKALTGRQLQQQLIVQESGLTSLELRLREIIHNDFVAIRAGYQQQILAGCDELNSGIGAGPDPAGYGGYALASLAALRAELLDGTDTGRGGRAALS